MLNKILTNLMIFMLAVLPVQVINAGIEKDSLIQSSMQSHMANSIQETHECMHAGDKEGKTVSAMPCCEDTSSHQCEGCNSCGDCAQVTNATFLPSTPSINNLHHNIQKIVSNHLAINGIHQKNLIRPPRILI